MDLRMFISMLPVILASPGAMAQGPSISVEPANASVSLGASVQFKCMVRSAHLPLTVLWHFRGQVMDW